jgi:hypothetical protein
MKWLVPIAMLVFIGLAVIMGKGLYHGLFPGKPVPFQTPADPGLIEKPGKPIKDHPDRPAQDVPELVFVDSGPMVPGCLVTKALEVYQVGQISPNGYVSEIHDNVAKCVIGPKFVFVVFSRAKLQVKSAAFFGMTSRTTVVTAAGSFTRGEHTQWGDVVEVDFRHVRILRVDGGSLYIAPDLKFADESNQGAVAQSQSLAITDVSSPEIENAKSSVVVPSN